MKPATLIGIVLIVIGALALAFQEISYTRERAHIDVGPVHATARERETISIPVVVSGVVVVLGVILLVAGRRRS
ncbi:MAG TPA: hypothetical protein VFK13_05890 [Gemmatimonadaceae bacterium]|nr:hypothetical protein [Gemmatimonadaceae bacterium]